jgi:hypothetical protein
MFCPNCGQQQVSESTKFCSRCGIAINGLAEWLADGGAAAARAAVMRNLNSTYGVPVHKEAVPPALASRRPKGIKRGVQIMFLAGVLAPIFFGLSIIVDNPGPLLAPLTIFLTGLSLLLYSHLFAEESSGTSQQSQPARLGTPLTGSALPPASNLGFNNVDGQQVRTKELVQPPSITEHTTRLLDND